jgi:hypothetical protein
MLRWVCALVSGAVVTGFALLLLNGEYRDEGPVLLSVTPDHGLHVGDFFVLGGWVVAVASLFLLVRIRPAP